jgi:hypothetical protein
MVTDRKLQRTHRTWQLLIERRLSGSVYVTIRTRTRLPVTFRITSRELENKLTLASQQVSRGDDRVGCVETRMPGLHATVIDTISTQSSQ